MACKFWEDGTNNYKKDTLAEFRGQEEKGEA